MVFPIISSNLKIWLERETKMEEIYKASEDCVGNKVLVLEPDGFNFSLIKVGWSFHKDFCVMLSKFHRRGRLNKELMLHSSLSFQKF